MCSWKSILLSSFSSTKACAGFSSLCVMHWPSYKISLTQKCSTVQETFASVVLAILFWWVTNLSVYTFRRRTACGRKAWQSALKAALVTLGSARPWALLGFFWIGDCNKQLKVAFSPNGVMSPRKWRTYTKTSEGSPPHFLLFLVSFGENVRNLQPTQQNSFPSGFNVINIFEVFFSRATEPLVKMVFDKTLARIAVVQLHCSETESSILGTQHAAEQLFYLTGDFRKMRKMGSSWPCNVYEWDQFCLHLEDSKCWTRLADVLPGVVLRAGSVDVLIRNGQAGDYSRTSGENRVCLMKPF